MNECVLIIFRLLSTTSHSFLEARFLGQLTTSAMPSKMKLPSEYLDYGNGGNGKGVD
jgi:hypothetical protein